MRSLILLALVPLVAEAEASIATHAGHGPVHVERLHRYDHAGLESFIQAEANWNPMSLAQVLGHEQAKTLKEMHSNWHEHQRLLAQEGAKFMQEHKKQFQQTQQELKERWELGMKQMQENMAKGLSAVGGGLGIQFAEKVQELPWFPGSKLMEKSKFGVISAAQKRALELHREKYTVAGAESGSGSESGAATEAEMLDTRDAAKTRTMYNFRNPDYHITELSNLYNSQYVGPIGVGTVKSQSNCELPKANEVKFVSGLDLHATEEEQKACHLQEESQIWVVFDTGSTNMWLSSDLCQQAPCTNEGRHRFNHVKSATFTEPTEPVQLDITFGTGELKGPQGIDDVHVGPFTVRQQTFGMVEHEIGNVFTEVPFEGIVGLAFPAMSANGATPFFDNVINQKVMKRNEFAFYFNADDKAGNGIFWGGVDPSFYEGEIRMFPVSQAYYWAVELQKFMIGDKELKVGSPVDQFMESPLNPLKSAAELMNLDRSPQLIVDSGTTYFTAESGLYQRIMSMLKTAPCSTVTDKTHPPLTYVLKDAEGKLQNFVIPAEEYMVSDEGGETCEPAFMKIDIPKQHGPGMLLGEVFMRNYFTVFDRSDGDVSKARIGFARAKKGPEVTASLQKLTGGLHSFKAGHTNMQMQSIIQKAESAQKFHHKPGVNEGSSQLQTGQQKKRFRANPWLNAKK